MSWTAAVNKARSLLGKLTTDSPTLAADASVPLGGRIGGSISFDTSAFLLASNSLVPPPDDLVQIMSISRLRADLQGAVHRLYIARGDTGSDAPECFLQIYTDAAGQARELVYYHRILRLIPASQAEQAAYLGEGGAGLGQGTFTLCREQFDGLDLPPALVERAFGDDDAIASSLSAGNPSQKHVPPFRGIETRIDDSLGHNGLRQEVVFMPYRRDVAGGGEEQLLISTEVVQEQDGDSSRREIHVDFMVGLVLSPDFVAVH
ncbi:hypothetical protein [Acidovorax sp.]|uniref:hypothetical protein n=1 Tax=Acidovorax sp. TaxID=1872122 RepID=UPI00391F56EB